MTPNGTCSADGIRQLVVGTGGAGGGSEISHTDALNLQRVKIGVYGVISLRANSYAWKFVPIAGKTFTDSGTTDCH